MGRVRGSTPTRSYEVKATSANGALLLASFNCTAPARAVKATFSPEIVILWLVATSAGRARKDAGRLSAFFAPEVTSSAKQGVSAIAPRKNKNDIHPILDLRAIL
jgi:hypothetical protein